MSVNDPLLKELKGHIYDLRQYSLNVEIHDHHALLLPFCQTLESIFRKGLRSVPSAFGRTKRDYWHWIETLYARKDQRKLPSSLCETISTAKECKKVHHSQGKGRLFIRVAIMKKVLHAVLECLLQDSLLVQAVYDNDSILGNEILAEILLSLLFEVKAIRFKLTLKNASFLDETWQLGVYKMYEFVPCKDLGISLGFVKGRAIVVDVEKGSVAAEDDQIEVGDVLDELYGKSLYGSRRGTISSLLNHFQGLPIYICIVKCLFWNGYVYPPIRPSLIQLRLNVKKMEERFHHKLLQLAKLQGKGLDGSLPLSTQISRYVKNTSTVEKSALVSSGYSVIFLGVDIVGKDNDIMHISHCIEKLRRSKDRKRVFLHIGETRITAIEKNTENHQRLKERNIYFRNWDSLQHVMSKHYTEISSCGRRNDYLQYFAFIAGETLCTISNNFSCYVFETNTAEECKSILNHIAQGFGRTHWAV